MAQAGTAQKVRLLMLGLIVPYWVNEILRAFALRLLMATKGLINQALMGPASSIRRSIFWASMSASMSACPTPIS